MKILYDGAPLFELEIEERGRFVMETNLRVKGIIWENLEKEFAILVARVIVERGQYEGTVRSWRDFGVYVTNINKPTDQIFDKTKLQYE